MQDQLEPRPSYQQVLRVVGAYLDTQPSARFALIEGPEDYILLLEQADGALRYVSFPQPLLVEQAAELTKGRRFRGSRYAEGWLLCATGHQDFLRALGYELDDAQAHSIALTELQDSVLLTYSFVDPAQGYQWRKRMLVLVADEITAIVEMAHGRRRRKGLLG